MKIYSEPGQGTTIKLYLPRSTQAEDLLVEKRKRPGRRAAARPCWWSRMMRRCARRCVALLGELGYRVLKAPDAQSALAVIESGVPIDLLFTDVVMPGPLKSPELARKAKERLPDLSVLFTSGYTENAIVHGGRLDEGVNLLSKPYTREALARKIRQVLAQDGKPPAQASKPPAQDGKPLATPAPAAEAVMAEQTQRGPLTVLVCEDDAIIRMDTADMIRDFGHTVLEAENGLSALDMAGAQPIDILLTDIGLPDIPGDELARRLRAVSPTIAIIFATGRDEVPGFENAPRTVLLRKPYRQHSLEKVLSTILD